MKNLSILIVDNDKNYVKELKWYLKNSELFSDVSSAADGEEALEMTRLLLPDIIIMDIVLPKLDGIGYLRMLNREKKDYSPFIIINTASQLPGILKTAIGYGVGYFMVKPQKPESICDTITDLFSEDSTKQNNVYNSEYTLEERVSGFLRHLGIPAHLNGYKYIRSAIIHTTNDIAELPPIPQKLYPRLAREFDTSSGSIERSIRHAIGVSWKRGNKKLLGDVFGYSPDTIGTRQPTNSEYIAMAADDFRLRLKHETAL